MTCSIPNCTNPSIYELMLNGTIQVENPEDYASVTNCRYHNGQAMVTAVDRKKYHQYIIRKDQDLLDSYAESEKLKTLRGEVALVRHLIQTILNKSQESQDGLVIYSPKITLLLDKCEKLVVSCSKLEAKMDSFLDSTSSIRFAEEIVDIINQHVSDSVILKKISDDILSLIQTHGS